VVPDFVKFTSEEQRTLFAEVGNGMMGRETARRMVDEQFSTVEKDTLRPLDAPNSLSLPAHPAIIPDSKAPPYAFCSKPELDEELKVKMFKLDWHALKPRIKLLCTRAGRGHYPAKDEKFKQIFWVYYSTLRSLFLSLATGAGENVNKVSSNSVMAFLRSSDLWNDEKEGKQGQVELTQASVTKIFFESKEGVPMGVLEAFDEGDVPVLPEQLWTRPEFFDILMRFALLKFDMRKFSEYDEAEKLHFLLETGVLRALPSYNNVNVFQWIALNAS
jgi:hypothetical protein